MPELKYRSLPTVRVPSAVNAAPDNEFEDEPIPLEIVKVFAVVKLMMPLPEVVVVIESRVLSASTLIVPFPVKLATSPELNSLASLMVDAGMLTVEELATVGEKVTKAPTK